MEGTETLCPHATISNHRWFARDSSRLLSVKPNEWMHLSPFYTRMHGEWLRYTKSISQFHCRFLFSQRWSRLPSKSPMSSRHDISVPGGYVRNLDDFFFHVSNRQVLWKTSMTFETCLVFMLLTMVSIIINIHLHKASTFVHAHVD